MQLDLIILAWWPYILKEALIKIPKIGCLNFHPSYLPYNRGKHPNFWSLVEDVPFGVSLHFVDTGIDSGSIAFQKIVPKSWEDTGKTLHEKGKREIVKLFQEKVRAKKPRSSSSFSGSITNAPFNLVSVNIIIISQRLELEL